MPRGDGTGPPKGVEARGGRMGGNRPGAGPSGYCVCSNCGEMVPHKLGTPCYTVSCPKCGINMKRV